ncbi:Glycosyl transferase family 2 [Rhodoblastus acidophilus]|uniref:Glycosyl transferase family 2 n=1 Tax=Rhodoblastus acidophilus TaxID=1074 RepID=A0A212QY36_RHOAC|nr:glycosyltransferase family 2 protein [Rhodoblastus acidophilus]PPQ40605.1 glycosyltransferase family 2 protein [Rhodoblastus acidophilus]RAI22957.1 glycosyltransferase family 2 protein [Rhodoblastus acidophilus]SNB64629.1 Glycosyl transferase family 2 [Rhodoblastus acidophilus]
MSSMLCVIVKNEAPYLVEWVAWHRAIGFDMIAVYENDSTDQTAGLLGRMRRVGLIDAHIPWPTVAASPQLLAYSDAARGCPTDWLMFLDADEFLMLKTARRVNDFIASFPADVACIGVNWRVFGSAGQTDYAPGLVMERFRRAARPEAPVNRHVKSVFRPNTIAEVHMHAPALREGRAVLANGAPLEMAPHGLATTVDWSVAQVNHYFCKSLAEYRIKRARGDVHRGADDPEKYDKYTDALFAHHDLNDERDDSAAPFLPELALACANLRRRLGVLQPGEHAF